MTNVFAVVGQHRTEPDRLLLLGDDGRYYAYDADGLPTRVEPSAAWSLDADGSPALPDPSEPLPTTGRPGRRGRRGGVSASRSAARPLAAALALLLALLGFAPSASAHAPALAVATVEADLLAAPDGAAPVLATLPSGTEVELTGRADGDHVEVVAAEAEGWVDVGALDDGRLATVAVPADAALLAAPSAGGEPLTAVPAGATVILTGATVDGFAAASYAGTGGWIAGAALGASP